MSEGIALMLRVGIVGANGHLGSHLSDILMRNTPHEIYPILRDESPPLDLDVVFVAVRPQDVGEMLDSWEVGDYLLVSFVAGVPISYYQEKGFHNVVRAMCNLYFHNLAYYPPHPRKTLGILNQIAGRAFGVDNEDEINVLTSVVGSGLAYTIGLMEQMSNYLLEHTTMPAEWCEGTVIELFSSATYYTGTHDFINFQETISAIASKGGTTEAGLEAMPSIEKALELATQRSRELGKEFGNADSEE